MDKSMNFQCSLAKSTPFSYKWTEVDDENLLLSPEALSAEALVFDLTGQGKFVDEQIFSEFAEGLKTSQIMCLSLPEIGLNAHMCLDLVDSLYHLPFLESLHLGFNPLQDQGVECVAHLVKESKFLKHLDLSRTGMRSEGCKELVKSIRKSKSLVSLVLDYNVELEDQAVWEVYSNLALTDSTVRNLSLLECSCKVNKQINDLFGFHRNLRGIGLPNFAFSLNSKEMSSSLKDVLQSNKVLLRVYNEGFPHVDLLKRNEELMRALFGNAALIKYTRRKPKFRERDFNLLFLGRKDAGKSSLVNKLFGDKLEQRTCWNQNLEQKVKYVAVDETNATTEVTKTYAELSFARVLAENAPHPDDHNDMAVFNVMERYKKPRGSANTGQRKAAGGRREASATRRRPGVSRSLGSRPAGINATFTRRDVNATRRISARRPEVVVENPTVQRLHDGDFSLGSMFCDPKWSVSLPVKSPESKELLLTVKEISTGADSTTWLKLRRGSSLDGGSSSFSSTSTEEVASLNDSWVDMVTTVHGFSAKKGAYVFTFAVQEIADPFLFQYLNRTLDSIRSKVCPSSCVFLVATHCEDDGGFMKVTEEGKQSLNKALRKMLKEENYRLLVGDVETKLCFHTVDSETDFKIANFRSNLLQHCWRQTEHQNKLSLKYLRYLKVVKEMGEPWVTKKMIKDKLHDDIEGFMKFLQVRSEVIAIEGSDVVFLNKEMFFDLCHTLVGRDSMVDLEKSPDFREFASSLKLSSALTALSKHRIVMQPLLDAIIAFKLSPRRELPGFKAFQREKQTDITELTGMLEKLGVLTNCPGFSPVGSKFTPEKLRKIANATFKNFVVPSHLGTGIEPKPKPDSCQLEIAAPESTSSNVLVRIGCQFFRECLLERGHGLSENITKVSLQRNLFRLKFANDEMTLFKRGNSDVIEMRFGNKDLAPILLNVVEEVLQTVNSEVVDECRFIPEFSLKCDGYDQRLSLKQVRKIGLAPWTLF